LNRKPNVYVLAGVNGAGKSSIGGAFLTQYRLPWYNPDTFARALRTECGMSPLDANSEAWQEGTRQLDETLTRHQPFAFETTLGGTTVCQKIRKACETHHVRIWYCGLSSPEQHIRRVQLRVARGGHAIPTEKILARWQTSRANLVTLLPFLTELSVFDNSRDVHPGEPIPEPKRVLHIKDHSLIYPRTTTLLTDTPEWAQPTVERALQWCTHPQRTH